ncbi:MAG: (4Fe-4S)-binding protein [Mycobacterium sp.]
MKVSADRDVCIGAGMCVMQTEAVFDQDDDGIVLVVVDEVPVDEQDNARRAVQLCPSGALQLVD